MMLQFVTSFLYASNLFCLKLIWFCLHRKGASGNDFLLEICWTVHFPNLQTGGNCKVLEDWTFWCMTELHFRLPFLKKTQTSSNSEGHAFMVIWQFKWAYKLSINLLYFCWLDAILHYSSLLLTFNTQRVSNLFLGICLLTHQKRSRGELFL